MYVCESRSANCLVKANGFNSSLVHWLMCVDLRKIKPYFFKYQTYAKGRWLGRKLIEVFNTEFRDRDNTFYVSSRFSLSESGIQEPIHWRL